MLLACWLLTCVLGCHSLAHFIHLHKTSLIHSLHSFAHTYSFPLLTDSIHSLRLTHSLYSFTHFIHSHKTSLIHSLTPFIHSDSLIPFTHSLTALIYTTSGSDILLFKKFREGWQNLKHQQINDVVENLQKRPKVAASDSLKAFVTQQLNKSHAREDCKECLILAGLLVGRWISVTIRKPGALHRAR